MADMTNMEVDAAMARGALAASANRARAPFAMIALPNAYDHPHFGSRVGRADHLIEDLRERPRAKLLTFEILGDGSGLHWKLRRRPHRPGVAMGIFGTAKWMLSSLPNEVTEEGRCFAKAVLLEAAPASRQS